MDFIDSSRQLIFPTPIWHVRYADYEEVNAAILEEIEAVDWAEEHRRRGLADLYEKRFAEDLFISLDRVPSAAVIVEAFAYSCNQIGQELAWDLDGHEVRVTALWAHVTPTGKSTQSHHHFPADLSCAYYLRARGDCGRLRFVDDRKHRALEPESVRSHELGRQWVEVEPVEGRMVIFPSWLSHQVGENRSGEIRVSLSLNAKLMPTEENVPWRGVAAGFSESV